MIHPFFSPFSRFHAEVAALGRPGLARWQRRMLNLRRAELEASLAAEAAAGASDLLPGADAIDWGHGAAFQRAKRAPAAGYERSVAAASPTAERFVVLDLAGTEERFTATNPDHGGVAPFPERPSGYDIRAGLLGHAGAAAMELRFGVPRGGAAGAGRLWLAFLLGPRDLDGLAAVAPASPREPLGRLSWACRRDRFDGVADGPLSAWWAGLPMVGGAARPPRTPGATAPDGSWEVRTEVPLRPVRSPARYPGLPRDHLVLVALSEPTGSGAPDGERPV